MPPRHWDVIPAPKHLSSHVKYQPTSDDNVCQHHVSRCLRSTTSCHSCCIPSFFPLGSCRAVLIPVHSNHTVPISTRHYQPPGRARPSSNPLICSIVSFPSSLPRDDVEHGPGPLLAPLPGQCFLRRTYLSDPECLVESVRPGRCFFTASLDRRLGPPS